MMATLPAVMAVQHYVPQRRVSAAPVAQSLQKTHANRCVVTASNWAKKPAMIRTLVMVMDVLLLVQWRRGMSVLVEPQIIRTHAQQNVETAKG